MQRRIGTLAVRTSLTLLATLLVDVAPVFAQKCDATRLLAFGKHHGCVLSAQSAAVRTSGTDPLAGQPKCSESMARSWAKGDGQADCTVVLSAEDALDESQERIDALVEAIAPDAEDTPSLCAALQLKAAGQYAACRLKAHQKSVRTGTPPVFAKCDSKLTLAFAKAESLSPSDCLTSGELESVRDQIEADTNGIVALVTMTSTTTSEEPTTTSTDPTTTTLDTTTTSTTLAPGLDDTFDGAVLDDSWTVLHPEIATIAVSGGQLRVQVDQHSNWYQTIESVLVYKLVTGDFDVHAPVHATKTSNPAQGPDPEYVLAGLLARDPASSPANSNFVHVAVGAGSNAFPAASEFKTTDDSSSFYGFQPIASTEGEVRLLRVGTSFSMHYRPIGSGMWQLLHSVTRADLPATLQVGMMAYDASSGSFDLTARFDEIVFE